MKRDYKYSSVLLIQILGGFLVWLIGFAILKITASPTNPSTSPSTNIITTILRTLISTVISFIIARGLLYNRMGSLGDYFDGFNHITLRAYLLALLVSGLPMVLGILYGSSIGNSALDQATLKFNVAALVNIANLLILIGLLIYGILTSFLYFVIADNPSESFGQLFKKVFKTGKDLWTKTIKIYFLYIILPLIITGIIGFTIYKNIGEADLMVYLLVFSILSIISMLVILFLSVSMWARLSDAYLDYKEVKTLASHEI